MGLNKAERKTKNACHPELAKDLIKAASLDCYSIILRLRDKVHHSASLHSG